jgi:hypothetical protein
MGMSSRTNCAAAIIIVAALATSGCSSGNDVLGTQDANAVNLNIVDGRTTRPEIERIYGPPTATSAQNEIWIYC